MSTAPIPNAASGGFACQMIVVGIIARDLAVGQEMEVLLVKTNHGRIETLEDECAEVGCARIAPSTGAVLCEHMKEEELQLLADRASGDDGVLAQGIVACRRV